MSKKIKLLLLFLCCLIFVSNYLTYEMTKGSYYKVGLNDGSIEEKILILNKLKKTEGLIANCSDVKKEDLHERVLSAKAVDLYSYIDTKNDAIQLCLFE